MRTIHYIYSSLSRQVLFVSLILLALSRILLLGLASHYKMEEFSIFNLPASIFLLFILILLSLFLLFAYRFFRFRFNEHTITYENDLLRKKRDFSLDSISCALFTNRCIKLYEEDKEKPLLKIPFFKFGIVIPFGIESFEKLLQFKQIPYDKKKFILPCQTRGIKLIRTAYWLLSMAFILNAGKIFILCFFIIKHYTSI